MTIFFILLNYFCLSLISFSISISSFIFLGFSLNSYGGPSILNYSNFYFLIFFNLMEIQALDFLFLFLFLFLLLLLNLLIFLAPSFEINILSIWSLLRFVSTVWLHSQYFFYFHLFFIFSVLFCFILFPYPH